jgi:hypothetical protein
VELDAAIERLTALAGELVDALVVSRGDGDRPLVQLSGAQLTVRTEPDGTLAAMSRPLIVGVGDNTLWLWPDRFVEANPLAAGGALEIVTEDGIFVVGPAGGTWLD